MRLLKMLAVLGLLACHDTTAPVPRGSGTPSDIGYHLVSLAPRGNVIGGGLYLNPVGHTWAINLIDDRGTSNSGTYTVAGTALTMSDSRSGAVSTGTIVGDTITVPIAQGASVWAR